MGTKEHHNYGMLGVLKQSHAFVVKTAKSQDVAAWCQFFLRVQAMETLIFDQATGQGMMVRHQNNKHP